MVGDGTMQRRVMYIQDRVKRAVKRLIVPDHCAARRVRGGPGRGTVALLNPRRDLQRQWGLYESELSRIYRQRISTGSVVYDIGAGDGVTTLLYAKLARFGSVLAFEPDPDAFAVLCENLKLNPRLASVITVVPEAFGSRLDPSWPAPTFVKIDVDGAELAVLEALTPMLGQCPTIVVETHGTDLERESIRKLTALGYWTRVIPNARWRVLWPEWRPIDQNRWLLAGRPRKSRATASKLRWTSRKGERDPGEGP